jgi:hypothetical protein
VAVHICTTATGRLFVTVKSSKQRYLIDTSSDLFVFPCKLIPQRSEHVNYILCTAKALPSAPTDGCPLASTLDYARISYGGSWWPTSHKPSSGLTSSSSPFLFLGLLVDCRNNRTLDGVTSLSVPAQAPRSLIPSHQWRYFGRHPPLWVPGSHSPYWSPARGAAQQRPKHPDYTRPTSHLPTTSTGTRSARYWQSRVRRHVAGLHSSPLRVLGPLLYISCPRTTVGVPVETIERWNSRPLSYPSYPWLLPPAP